MDWTYFGTTDYLEHLDPDAPDSQVLLGLTLNLLALAQAPDPYPAPAQADAEKLVFPEFTQPGFQVITFTLKDGLPTGFASKTGTQVAALTAAEKEPYRAALRPSIDLLRTLPTYVVDENKDDNTLEPETLSGLVAGMSQKGYPVAHALNLACWLRADLGAAAAAAPDAAAPDTYVITVPAGFKLDEARVGKIKDGNDPALEYIPADPAQKEVVSRLVIKAVKLPDPKQAAATPSLPDFVGQHMTMQAADMLNWRKDFDERAGEFLDPLYIRSRVGPWPVDSDADDPTLEVGILKGAKREARANFMMAALALAHDLCDKGLKTPLRAYPTTAEDQAPGTLPQPAFPYPGTLAWYVANAWIISQTPALSDPEQKDALDQKVRRLLAETDPVPLGWPMGEHGPASGPAPDLPQNWLGILSRTLQDLEGDKASGYSNLRNALHDLWTLTTLPTPPTTPAPWLIQPAMQELCLMLEDDEVLRRLFILQWNLKWTLGDSEVNKLRKAIDDWCTDSGASFSKLYHAGLAGSMLAAFADGLQRLPDADNEDGNAQTILTGLLKEYRTRRLGRLPPFNTALGDKTLLEPVMPSEDEIKTMVETGYKGDLPPQSKDTPWYQRLLGKDRALDSGGTPPALLVPSPLLPKERDKGGYDPFRHSGVLLFCRRTQPDTPWYLATVGDLVVAGLTAPPAPPPAPAQPAPPMPLPAVNPDEKLLDDVANTSPAMSPPTAASYLVPAPLPLGEGLYIQLPGSGQLVEYSGSPIGVLLWKEYLNWRADSAQATVYKDSSFQEKVKPLQVDATEPKLLHRQILSADDHYLGHGPVPGLRYSQEHSYEFFFSPVHNSGALPRWLRQDPQDPDTLGQLAPVDVINQRLAGKQDDLKLHAIVVHKYLRRIPVGVPRLLQPAVKDQAGKPQVYTSAVLSVPPQGVIPIASDIRGVYEEAYPDAVQSAYKAGNKQPPAALPLPPAPTVVLLHQDRPEIRLQIAPPATDVADWAIWTASFNDGSEKTSDFIADVERMIREKRQAAAQSTTPKKEEDEIAGLIDDPAVEGLCIRQRTVFSKDMDAPAAFTYTLVGFMRCSHSIPEPDDDPGLDQPIGHDHELKLRNQLRTRFSSKLEAHTLVLRHADAPGQSDPADAVPPVLVPVNQVCELEIIPCVKQDTWSKYFGLYTKEENTDLFDISQCPPTARLGACTDDQGVQWVAVMSGVVRLWLESAPIFTDSKPPAVFLPTPEQVWYALRLGPAGIYTQRSPRVERLEVALQPQLDQDAAEQAKLFNWVLVSIAEARWQRWYWRGMPEGLEADWSSAPVTAPRLLESPNLDAAPANIKTLRTLESPSWAERRPADAEVASTHINLAAWWLKRKTQTTPPATQINTPETGDPLDHPEHILARLKVWSRYSGLKGHEEPAQGCIRPQNLAGPGTEYHRRLTLRGKLKHPRPQVPRVKMVLPLFGAPELPSLLPKPDSQKPEPQEVTRPGFLVILRDTLPSPFHHLTANVEWARLDSKDSSGPKQTTLPELAPDPITSPETFDMQLRSAAYQLRSSRLEGSACGLTYEREADSPLFPNAAFMFKAPLDLAYGTHLASGISEKPAWNDDWFVKVRFRWEIGPSTVMLDDPEYLTGDLSGAWQLRLLAPAEAPQMWMDEKSGHPVPDKTEVSCMVGEKIVTFTTGTGQDAKNLQPLLPTGLLQELDDEEPLHVYLLAAWSLVSDVLNPEPSKTAHSLHLFVPPASKASKPERIFIYQAEQRLPPHGANLLRIFTRGAPLKDIIKKLKSAPPLTDPRNQNLELLMDWLFPDSQTSIDNPLRNWQDAGGIIDRCSAPLPAC